MATTTASLSAAYTVHTGFWINWSRGSVFGSTVTVTQTQANLIIKISRCFGTGEKQ